MTSTDMITSLASMTSTDMITSLASMTSTAYLASKTQKLLALYLLDNFPAIRNLSSLNDLNSFISSKHLSTEHDVAINLATK